MLDKLSEFFKKRGWKEKFSIGRKKAKKVLGRFKKNDKFELDKEAMELLEFYGIEVAEFRVARSIEDVYVAAKEIGYPVVLKTLTSRAVHRGDAGGVAVVKSPEEVKEAYPQVLGEIFTRMPWLLLEGVLVQAFIDGDKKLWLKLERAQKKVLPFKVWKKDDGGESEKVISSEEELEGYLSDEYLEGVFAFFMDFPEIRKLEADFVEKDGEKILVDSKLYLFE